jgi:hypothetical protein
LQDQTDGPQGRWIGQATGQPFTVDGNRPKLSEITGLTELLPDRQDEILQRTIGAVDRRGQTAGAVGPVHPIQALVARPRDPALHRAQSDAKLIRDLTQRQTAADGFDHLASLLDGACFLLMAVSSLEGF